MSHHIMKEEGIHGYMREGLLAVLLDLVVKFFSDVVGLDSNEIRHRETLQE